jgi:hypothetical protein
MWHDDENRIRARSLLAPNVVDPNGTIEEAITRKNNFK